MHLVGVVAAEERARAVAGAVQALDGLEVGVERLAVGVDADAVDGGEQRAAQRRAEERRRAQLGQAVGLLAEVHVLLVVVQLVVALARGQKRLLRLGVEAQLVSQLVQGVGLLQAAVGKFLLEELVQIVRAVFLLGAEHHVARHGRAAQRMEALHVFAEVAVPHADVHAAGLLRRGMR